MDRRELPIFEIERELLARAAEHRRLIVRAPTGSGKSTQIPQMLLDAGLLKSGRAVILQPRRLPTRLLAARVAAERGAKLGAEVGYQIRFENIAGRDTRILYETEGVLLRQMLSHPRLDGVAAILFDEFHERHLYGDVTLARALQLQRAARPDLLLVVMSATLPSGPLDEYLAPCAALEAHGRLFPVITEYLDRPADFDRTPPWEAAAAEFERVCREGEPSDTLVFMPGAYEISRTVQALENSPAARGRIILPLHGELPTADQDAAVARYDRPKIIVATNVAESSLTIEGVRLVVDSGLARIPRFDPARGINTLLVEKISRASADQRAGRAGRTAPGRCVRLWTEREHAERPVQEVPEIRRLDLSEVMLTLRAAGAGDLRELPWLEPPGVRALDRAEMLLRDLGALDEKQAVTELGRRMAGFPVHPRYARMMIAAGEHGCVRAVALIAALTQGRSLWMRKPDKSTLEQREDVLGEEGASDFFGLMRAFRFADSRRYDVGACNRLGIHANTARQVRALAGFFLDLAEKTGLKIEARAPDTDAICKCILTGFSDQVAKRLDAGTLRCQLVHGRKGVLARESAVQGPLLVVSEVREVEGRGGELSVILSLATAIRAEWLEELFPGDFSEPVDVEYDAAERRVVAWRRRMFRDLPLESKRVDPPPADAAGDLLAEEVINGRIKLPHWDETTDQWIARVNSLAAWCPELGLTAYSEEDRWSVLRVLCRGAVSARDLKDRPVTAVFKDQMDPARRALVEKHAPERIELSNGRRARLTYTEGEPPHIAQRIQDLYDVKETPRIAKGRVPVVVEILGPNHRPVQVTRDLAGFWRDHYPRVKKEMQRKYPKHEWR
ncbi:MAG TPA: ATP-dependent helicase HrpB [Kiritimatiellia bacterium]|nr:ATP-dependent helicase HrpB [Kiritimatiellia bacterium]HRZ12860.1 ATP-dependent helicase HrpB [Kiritimatiellia bacterium]HSA18188.1 ATP-dependent helicase HrpB [Kiritimatiellia bacterium]